MERICHRCCRRFEGEGVHCPNCRSSSASSACSGEDARQADKASAVTQRSGDEVIADEARWMLRSLRQRVIYSVVHVVKVDGMKVRIEMTRQK
jgi:hypothetical protein